MNFSKHSGKIRVFILAIVLLAFGIILYRETLWGIAECVLKRKESSHGVFVPFIAGYFLWINRARIRSVQVRFALFPCIIMVGAGLLLFIPAKEMETVALAAISFILVGAGLVVGLFGTQMLKEVGFPLVFLSTMIPLPNQLHEQLATWVRSTTTHGAVSILQFFCFPIYRENYNIFFPDFTLYVSSGCSGIRYLISYVVFSLAYAYLFKKNILSRVAVVLAALPMALIGGVLRLSSIFLSAYYISPFMAEDRPHKMISWFVFLVVLIAAVWLDSYLTRRWGSESFRG